MPKVSIIMPAYNAGQFIGETIRSVQAQTFTDWEIIVIDNDSTDNTLAEVDYFCDARIRVISFRNNGVIAASRNRGAECAAGDWIAFLDADDLWLPSKLERCFEVMGIETDMLTHGQRYFGAGRIPWDMAPKETQACSLRRLLFGRRNPVGTSSVLIKRLVFRLVGGFATDHDLITVEDWELWLRIAGAGYRIQCISEVLGKYRLHAASTAVATGPDRQLFAGILALRRHFQKIKRKTAVDYVLLRRKMGTLYYTAGRKLHDSGDFRGARNYYIASAKLYPFSFYLAAAGTLCALRRMPRLQQEPQTSN